MIFLASEKTYKVWSGLLKPAILLQRNSLVISSSTAGIDSFTWEHKEDGTIQLIPQQVVSAEGAKLIQVLKSSVDDFKSGRPKKIPKKRLSDDDEKLWAFVPQYSRIAN